MDFGLLNEFSICKTAFGAVSVFDENRIDDLTVVGHVLFPTELIECYTMTLTIKI